MVNGEMSRDYMIFEMVTNQLWSFNVGILKKPKLCCRNTANFKVGPWSKLTQDWVVEKTPTKSHGFHKAKHPTAPVPE